MPTVKEAKRPAPKRSIAIWAAGLVLGVVAFAGACDKSGELKSALDSHRSEWSRQLSALQGRATNLESRFKALPPLPSGDGAAAVAARAKRRGLQASIIGTRQALVDIQSHAADSTRELEAAIGRGEADMQEGLGEVVGRVNGYIRQQEQALAVNEEAMTHTGEDVRP